ncbi:MAG TPA: two-component regulator propeller domain-containing protein, partial [Verrucomicrobiota bacterium]|nr:two-component regulator propeller domain-containing protein [Verrucomicrobiota bacterium]
MTLSAVIGVCAGGSITAAGSHLDEPVLHYVHEAHRLPAGGASDVRALALARDGGVWVGTAAGVFVLSPGGEAWVPVVLAGGEGPVFDVAAGSDGAVWAGAWNGLHGIRGGR